MEGSPGGEIGLQKSKMDGRRKLYLEENAYINLSGVDVLCRGVEERGGCKNMLGSIVDIKLIVLPFFPENKT